MLLLYINMIIPVKCFTCGKVLADKYRYYLSEVRKQETNQGNESIHYLTESTKEKTIQGVVLDNINIKKMCCRRHMLTHVDIE